MEPIITSALIGGGASLLGGAISSLTSGSSAKQEYENQKEFAQNSIRWRVADAKAAGLHPLYALGAQGASYSPQAAVGDDFGISSAGQAFADIYSRKPNKMQQKFQNEMNALSIQSAILDQKAKQADINKTNAEIGLIRSQIGHSGFGTNNGFSVPVPTGIGGQSISSANSVGSQPMHVLTTRDKNAKEATGAFGFDKVASQLQYERKADGTVAIRPSKENTEDDIIKTFEALYNANNKYKEKELLRSISSAHPAPKGYEYELFTDPFGLSARLVPKGTAKPIEKNVVDWFVHSPNRLEDAYNSLIDLIHKLPGVGARK